MPINFEVQGDSVLVPNANSLCDLAFADQYHENRGNSEWLAMKEEARQAALIHGTDFLSAEFHFRGWPTWGEDAGQVVAFPRDELYDTVSRPIRGVPPGVKRAVCELALFATRGNLYGHTSTTTSTTTKINKHKIKIGPLEETIDYEDGSGVINTKVYPQIVNWLRPYTAGSSGRKVQRA